MVPPASLDEGGVDKLIDYEKTLLLTVCLYCLSPAQGRCDENPVHPHGHRGKSININLKNQLYETTKNIAWVPIPGLGDGISRTVAAGLINLQS